MIDGWLGAWGDETLFQNICGSEAAIKKTYKVPEKQVEEPSQLQTVPMNVPSAVQVAKFVELPSLQDAAADRNGRLSQLAVRQECAIAGI